MLKKKRIEKYFVFCLLVFCFLWIAPASGQDYPKGPVQIVIPFSPGGATDIFWRGLGDHLSKNLKAPLVLINKPGGGGIVGMSTVVNSKPDGYTLCVGNSDTLDTTPLFTKDLPFDTINDLTYVTKFSIIPQLIVVRAESPFKTLEDLIAFAKANPKKLKASTPGVGTQPHISLEVLNDEAKTEIIPVAFGGGGEALTAVLGGHVDFGMNGLPVIKSQLMAGKVRILAFQTKKRLPLYPDIPTTSEKGYKQTVIETGIGLVGPKGLPPTVVRKWEEVAQATMKDANAISLVQKMDFVVDVKRGEEYKKEVVDEYAMFKKILAGSEARK